MPLNTPLFKKQGIITKIDLFSAIMVGYLLGVLLFLATLASKGVFP
jgi:F0F1-type ATP synthase assembly protein I